MAPPFMISAVVSGQLQASTVSVREKSPRYPLDKRRSGPQSRSGHRGLEKNLAPAGNRTPSIQRVAISTELSPSDNYL
jgi:hypothetical protein